MKKLLLLFLLLSPGLNSIAQKNYPQLLIDYYAPYGTHFGGKAGVCVPWKTVAETKDSQKTKELLLSPQLGYFFKPDVTQDFVIDPEIGLKFSQPQKRSYSKLAISPGWLVSIKTVGGSVHLGTGEIIKEKENTHYFLPTFSYEIAWKPKKTIGYSSQFFYGRKFGLGVDNSAFFGLNLGIIINLNNTNTENE